MISLSAHDVLPVMVYGSLVTGLVAGAFVSRKLWWLAGLVAPIGVVVWPEVSGDAGRSWSGGDFTYQAVAVIFALEMLCGFYLAVAVGWGVRRVVRVLGRRVGAIRRS
ncbi:hypothetical protein [Mycobacterium sp.]|uniref:hypothetical protein n=1 Tax=Mycobacterium sp. TaxID=1785 RepID=UPI003F7F8D34